MNNVYALVEHFYENHVDAEKILAQEIIEKYLRKKAWHGADDAELRRIWQAVSMLITYVEQMNLYSFASLTIYDYQEILYRLAQDNQDFSLQEDCVNAFFDIVEDFYRSYQKKYGSEEDLSYIRDARESLYDNGHFVMPPRRSQDEFYTSLNHQEEVTEEDVDHLNDLLDNLLTRIGRYFHQKDFERDMDRALLLYSGPECTTLPQKESQSDEKDTFWLSFWDYFLFDYHMIETDEVPLRYFFKHEQENLTIMEQDIIRDLLKAKFTVFYVVGIGNGFATCRNLFTDELIDLPDQDFMFPDIEHLIFFGHLHARGVMMLNYVTSLPASGRLRRRMRDIILRQFEIFRCQKPDAVLDDFFQRDAVVVRHTLHIMATFAQLNVVPLRKMPKPLPANPAIRQSFEEEENILREVAYRMGYSLFSGSLMCKLFEDYMSVADPASYPEEMPAIVTACLLSYGKINDLGFERVPALYSMFGATKEDVYRHMEILRQRLHCTKFDPRYLTEEAFVTSLYVN
ncbi:hypothetical protein [Mitsuokella sp. WILCCON 0060]|uniref:hypothetical protein n=1 Tax=unclassified Mitsuokella TaxID=2637239 RepID=UPI003F127621